MMRSKAALAAVVAGALFCGIGCGDGGQKTGASAEPAKSGAAAAASGAPKASGAAAAASGTPAAKPADTATAGADVLKYMPKECDEGRVFLSLNKFLGSDGAGLESIVGKAMAQGDAEGKKAEAVMKALKDGGIDPLKDGRDVAVCINKDEKKVIVAVSFASKAEKPAEVFAKSMEAGSGKAPKSEEKDGVTYVQGEGKDGIMAFIGKDIMLVGGDRAALETAAKGTDGAADFGDAKSHVIWAKIAGKNTVDIAMKEAGEDFDLTVKANAGAKAAGMKDQFEKMLPEVDKMAESMPFTKPLLPIAKNGKVAVEGENVTFTTKFPKAAISGFISEVSKVDPKELMKGMRF